MAFSFGAGASGASPFGGTLFGAPAASSASAFGATAAPAAPAFGAASAPAFGATSAPAFGAANSAPAFGAAAAAPAFGASAPASAFGAAPAASPFGSTTTAFGTSPGGLFGQTTQQATSNALVPATGGLFGAQQQQQQQQAVQAARPGLNYKTKFEELPPQMQQELQKIQTEISSYRDEARALDGDSRLHDTVSIKQSLDSETAALRQTLQSLRQAAVAEEEGLLAFRERVMVLMRSTETAIRLYQRSRLWREVSQAAGTPSAQQLLSSQAVADSIAQPVVLPNPYLGLAVRGFREAMEQYHRCISELERVVPSASSLYGTSSYGGGGAADADAVAVQGLPVLVAHMHDYFVHVAARLEKLHAEVARSRDAYLAQCRARGDYGDPFADARAMHHMPPGPGKNSANGPGFGSTAPGGSGFYSFGGPGTAGPQAGGAGGAAGSAFGGGGVTPASPATGAAAGGAGAALGGGGLSPGPLGTGGGMFGAAGAAGVGAFGTPLMGAAAAQQQQQQQRMTASRAGSSSSKKR
ncbi:hypothetical protein HYH03_012628 [Edaphochlamys debaryana]|uniref:Nucleoporin p58/p45 n=1 Tax=Edaphochlamys debaryana TaxID=47281 RepID=A0A836BVB1_9CHLO|nr:hypothetical protein HYH03_012628 [Edaphochlamys debaryana]|eukprot:KAG2488829.1 hypothetical protein HYH03_012628 [Edaphochlamys debaryana]